jgi:hypothetical protein
MQVRFGAMLIGTLLTLPLAAQAQTVPGTDWQRRTPAAAGIKQHAGPFRPFRSAHAFLRSVRRR